jgi:hypothetical protein
MASQDVFHILTGDVLFRPSCHITDHFYLVFKIPYGNY